MLVTTIPGALARGRGPAHRARADRLRRCGRPHRRGRGARRGRERHAAGGRRVRLARAHFVLAAGAIGTPALLLRSDVPDPARARRAAHLPASDGRVAPLMPSAVDGYEGAPQTIYSDHFLDTLPRRRARRLQARGAPAASDPRGHHAARSRAGARGLDARVRQPAGGDRAACATASTRTARRARAAARRRHAGARLPDRRLSSGTACGARYLAMAEVQFAAGAKQVMPMHEDAGPHSRAAAAAQAAIGAFRLAPLRHAGRLRARDGRLPDGPGAEAAPSSTRSGRHHHVANLSVADGSLFPTIDRREPAAVDLRHRRPHRRRARHDARRDPRRLTRCPSTGD